MIELFLAKFPNGVFSPLARAMLEELTTAALQAQQEQEKQNQETQDQAKKEREDEAQAQANLREGVRLTREVDNARLVGNYADAVGLYRQAEALGNVVAIFNLAVLHGEWFGCRSLV